MVTVTTTWVLGRIWRVRIDQALGTVLDTESPICVHCGGGGYGCRSHLIWFLTDTQCQSRPNFGYEVPTVPPKKLPEKVNFQQWHRSHKKEMSWFLYSCLKRRPKRNSALRQRLVTQGRITTATKGTTARRKTSCGNAFKTQCNMSCKSCKEPTVGQGLIHPKQTKNKVNCY